MNDRLIQLEEKHAHLERTVEQLDGVIRELYERLDQTRSQLARVTDELNRTQLRLDEATTPDEA